MEVSDQLTKQITEVKYLSVENTERYRPIIRYFFKQYEKLEYWLFKEDVFSNLKDVIDDYTIELCEQDLERLVDWGSLSHMQDTSNVKTIEEFKNRRFRYQLTEYAIEIERMVLRLETLKVETASLEPKLFEKLRLLLSQIVSCGSPEEVHTCFEELNETFTKLNNNYKDFLKTFHEAKSEELMRSESFLVYKDRVIDYLKNFVAGFQLNEIKIEKILASLPDDFEDNMIGQVMAYQRELPILEPNFDYDYLEEVLRGKWRSIVKWFSHDTYEESEAERLKRAINTIINQITKYVVAIIETNTSINRMEEYRHILKLFLNCPDLRSAEQLSSVVFGIEKVKHISQVTKETDSISVSPRDSEGTFISLKSHSRKVREKSVKSQVADKFFEKECQLKRILEEKQKKEELLRKYISQGEILIRDLDQIESFERRFILSLLTKGMNKEIVQNNEFGVMYQVLKMDEEEAKMICVDGIMTMSNLKIVFMGDVDGV